MEGIKEKDIFALTENCGNDVQSLNPFGSKKNAIAMMNKGLEEEQFVVFYQPQYNHSTGLLVGAEALVRWKHPQNGMISPGMFIPLFEETGLITDLDYYVFEKMCRFVRHCLDQNITVVPISVNLTRQDFFAQGFPDSLEAVRRKYNVPVKLIRLELTESSALGNAQQLNEILDKLHSYGYVVEMDDFGTGYSSLNILKDIKIDIVKLDMALIQTDLSSNQRGGTILSAIVRMLNWLQLPIIAEGVETQEQADFLCGIGCDIIQGFLYSRPLPQSVYKKLLQDSPLGVIASDTKLAERVNAKQFWQDDSLETLVFSNYVGAAAVFNYQNGKTELLRINKKYLREIGMNLTERDLLYKDLLEYLDPIGRDAYREMLDKAIKSQDEEECETWRSFQSNCCGAERICLRVSVRMIRQTRDMTTFYALVRNVTAEKNYYTGVIDSERRFRMASEQAQIYCWEYTVATKEMRPCFRCMRDLGLPPLLTNYPEPVIASGLFPADFADMYRDWHRQIAAGVPSLEAVIPLTVGRIPFHVRYTTEFDENGRPLKAYGSATMVVDYPKS